MIKFNLNRTTIHNVISDVMDAVPGASDGYLPDADGNTYYSFEGLVDTVLEIIDNEKLHIKNREELFELIFEII